MPNEQERLDKIMEEVKSTSDKHSAKQMTSLIEAIKVMVKSNSVMGRGMIWIAICQVVIMLAQVGIGIALLR